jgi:hypothetical protein
VSRSLARRFRRRLFAIAALLYLYKGFSKAENYLLNAAALLLVGVALFPTELPLAPAQFQPEESNRFSLHGACAVAAFLCLAAVVFFLAEKTLRLLPEALRSRFKMAYKTIGMVMGLSPVTAFVFMSILRQKDSFIFFIEAAGIWAFAAYWLVKSFELKKSEATRLALEKEVETTEANEVKRAL